VRVVEGWYCCVPQGLIRHSEVLERDAPQSGDASEALQRVLSRSVSVGEVLCCYCP